MNDPRPTVAIHWFRRDLRLADNHGLFRALTEHGDVLLLFIFDTRILGRLEQKTDRRVDLIHRTLAELKTQLEAQGSTLLVEHGDPAVIWKDLLDRFHIRAVTAAQDHEPYGRERDAAVHALLAEHGVPFRTYKDISIFDRDDVLKEDGRPYTVFTPYARKWKALLQPSMAEPFPSEEHLAHLFRTTPASFPSLNEIGFQPTDLVVPPEHLSPTLLKEYEHTRDRPDLAGTSRMSVHLRFGRVSIRALVRQALEHSAAYLNELIWREFFLQILWHFPQVEHAAFKPAYEHIRWRNNGAHFRAWCEGRTGYPLVDAGMRELNVTGSMHNRVRMVTAGFLTKHLLTDWRWGEAYFAEKLLDFELSSNNGNWQWASGSGCDAAPWFRVFNPSLQLQRFDPELTYVNRWVEEYRGTNYARPIVVHSQARAEAITAYQAGIEEARSWN